MPLTSRQTRTKQARKMKKLKSVGPGYLKGYLGLKATAQMISWYVPKCEKYVEPLAGLGRVAKHVKSEKIHLNDLSDFAYSYLKKHFADAIVTHVDFEEMFALDSPKTVFLIDPPWTRKEYVKGCDSNAFCDRTSTEYYDVIFEWLPKLKGHWFVCGKKDNKRLKDGSYYHKLFISKKKIMGSNISTLVMSNKPFVMHHQTSLNM